MDQITYRQRPAVAVPPVRRDPSFVPGRRTAPADVAPPRVEHGAVVPAETIEIEDQDELYEEAGEESCELSADSESVAE